MATKLTDEHRARVAELHAQGLSRNKIAAEVGISNASVSNIAKDLGLKFDRASMEHALKAELTDRKARRNKIIDRLYTRTEKLLARVEADKFEALVPVAPGRQEATTLEFVPGAEESALSRAMSAYLTAAEKLEKVDADGAESAAAVDQWLAHMTGGVRGRETA